MGRRHRRHVALLNGEFKIVNSELILIVGSHHHPISPNPCQLPSRRNATNLTKSFMKHQKRTLRPLRSWREFGLMGTNSPRSSNITIVMVSVCESCIEPFKGYQFFNGCLFLSPRRGGAETQSIV